ncbi:MAG: acyl carrier protein [Acetobacteraceae bacterium]|nr:acyl carrier protein [Pseudomonadota bacterium]
MTTQLADLTHLVRDLLRNHDIDLEETAPFDDLPLWDSMYLVALVVEVEDHFGVMFEPEEIEGIVTPADLLRLIANKRVLVRN